MELHISDRAAARIAALLQAEATPTLRLRISVSGGGCAGFQYHFTLDPHTTPDDQIFEKNGAQVIIDQMCLGLISGSELDYEEDLMSAGFRLRNPQAQSSCGCGNSFSV